MLDLPASFLNSISNCCGFEKESFIESHQLDAPTSIRTNPLKPVELNLSIEKNVLWNANGFYLKERPNFTHDALFQAGCYYVQEAGSMFIQHALLQNVDFNNQILAFDVCAAPGGKSTLVNSLLNNNSVLVSNEVSKPRADVLCQNLTKWGTSNVIVTNNDPSAFSEMENVFDIIIVDAPCSGSGLFRKQHDAIDEWSEDNVNLCAQRQKRILADVVNSLTHNGILVYSTCSYSEKENEEIADWLINEFGLESIKLKLNPQWGIVESIGKSNNSYGYRFYPNKTTSEGFFCTVLKKNTHGEEKRLFKKNKHELFTELKAKEKEVFSKWLSDLESSAIIKFKDDYLLTNTLAIDFINKYSNLYFKKVGTTIGTVIKNDVIPNHDLAMSIHKSNDIAIYECTLEEAILFLKKVNVKIESENGWILISYKGFGLGWIKQLGNRFNNYLPNEFRILK